MLNSSYTMLMFSFAYLSMAADLSGVISNAEEKIPIHADAYERGISLPNMISVLWKRKFWVVAITICCAMIAYFSTKCFITPMYKSTVLFYVNNKTVSTEMISGVMSNSDIQVSRSLVNTYSTILKSRQTLNEAAALCGITESYETVNEMVMASAVNGTEILKMVVTNSDPIQAEQLANAIAVVFAKRISGVMDGTSISVIDYAVVAEQPSSPSKSINTLIGGIIGFLLMAMLLLLKTERRRKIDVFELIDLFSYPVLAEVPTLNATKNMLLNWKGKK